MAQITLTSGFCDKDGKKIYGAKRLIDLLENPDDKDQVWPILCRWHS